MKVGIVTVYRSYNTGSFWQAYALGETLKQMDCEVCYTKTKPSLHSRFFYRFLQAVKYVLLGNKQKAYNLLKVYFNYKSARKNFNIVKNNKNIDCMVYGSDTIWNFDDDYFYKNRNYFFGKDYNGKKIAYAVSMSNTPEEKMLSAIESIDVLNDFKALSLRDDNTYNFVRKNVSVDKNVEKVLDPTFLICPKKYGEILPKCSDENYIFLYYFCKVPENVINAVREYAKKTNRKIIVLGEQVSWADKNIINEPFEVLSYFYNADYIITNTFHGTAFSLIFNKQFIDFGGNKIKVKELLQDFDLTNRLSEETDDFSHLFEENVDFTEVNEKIKNSREHSLKFLYDALN